METTWTEFVELLIERPGMMLIDQKYGSHVAALTGFDHANSQASNHEFRAWIASNYGGLPNLPFFVLVFNHANELSLRAIPLQYSDEQGDRAVAWLRARLAEFVAR